MKIIQSHSSNHYRIIGAEEDLGLEKVAIPIVLTVYKKHSSQAQDTWG